MKNLEGGLYMEGMKGMNRGGTAIFLAAGLLCLVFFVNRVSAQSIPNPYPAVSPYTVPITPVSIQQWSPSLSIPGAWNLAMSGVPSQFGNAGQWYGSTLFGGFFSPAQTRPSGPNLKCRIKTDASVYDLGELVIITVMVENSGGSTAKVTFPAGQRVEVTVNDHEGRVWQLSSHMEDGQDGASMSIRSGETVSFEIRWGQLDEHGMMVPSGSYTIEALLCAADDRYRKGASTGIAINGVPRFSSCDELMEKLEELRDGTIYEETDPSPHLSVSTRQAKTTSSSSSIMPMSFWQISSFPSFMPVMAPISTFAIPSYQVAGAFPVRTSSATSSFPAPFPIGDGSPSQPLPLIFGPGQGGAGSLSVPHDSNTPIRGGGGFPPWPIPSPGVFGAARMTMPSMFGPDLYAIPTASYFTAGYGGLAYSAYAATGGWSGLGSAYTAGGIPASGFGLYAGYSPSFSGGYGLSSSGLGWGGYAPIGGYSNAARYRAATSGTDIRLNGDGDPSAPLAAIGADEADIAKADDAYIYMIKGKGVRIIRVHPPEDIAELPGIEFPGTDFTPKQLYVEGNIMAVIGEEERGSETIQFVGGQAYLSPIYLRPTFTRVFLYDITDRAQVIQTRSLRFEAQYKESRGTDDTLYLIMREDPPYELLDEDLPDARAVLPVYSDSLVHGEGGGSVEVDTVCGCEEVAYFPRHAQPRYLLVVGIPLQDYGQAIDAEVILGDCDHVLSSAEGLYVASTDVEGDAPVTLVYRFDYTDQGILVAGSAKVGGEVINASGMHGHDGRFMIATNSAMAPLQSDLYVFNDRMRLTGVLSGLAPGVTMESVRFFEDRCYMLTGREGYPFLVISLDDPMAPWVAEELDILGGSEYLHMYDAHHILGFGREILGTTGPGLRIALYDITDTAAPILVGEEEIGGRKTGSALFTDHRALLVNPSENLMAFPVTKTEDVEGMPYPYQYTFQGAYVFDIDGTGLYRMAEITHHPSGTFPRPSYAQTGDHITRVLCIGDTYCTVSENLIRVFDIQGHTEAGTLAVQ